ncbi:MAG: transporter substrate-binding domain-containing protein [Oscillospiraceae bacterium]|nr:transporter substrate-binding domain-containing protein [Oscillospiraceae bacterium]
MKKDLRKILIVSICFVLALSVSLVGCLGRNGGNDCECAEECTPECACGCSVAAVFAPLGERNNVAIAVIGTNAALANVGIDMMLAYLETQGKTADFNEIHDRDALRALKSGTVDVAISFGSRTNDREIMWLPIISRDSERFYIAFRRSDSEFANKFAEFVNEYHRSGDLERLARQHMANYRDFMADIQPPFRFER